MYEGFFLLMTGIAGLVFSLCLSNKWQHNAAFVASFVCLIGLLAMCHREYRKLKQYRQIETQHEALLHYEVR
jgi:uncharacterized membrane protein